MLDLVSGRHRIAEVHGTFVCPFFFFFFFFFFFSLPLSLTFPRFFFSLFPFFFHFLFLLRGFKGLKIPSM
jgi:hypothetical protein